MPATDPENTSMEDCHTMVDEKGSLTDIPSSAPPTTSPVSSSPFCSTLNNFTGETVVENRAVSITSNDCASTLSSPAEASPAKPAVTSPSSFEGTMETSPATSNLASASDSLKRPGTGLVTIIVLPTLTAIPSNTFGTPNKENYYPASQTFKGVTVTLENNSVWKQFHSCGTEMIVTKQGRRMFPYCRYRLSGLDPERYYKLVLSIDPVDQFKYRWNRSQWEICGLAENPTQGLIRAFSHQYSVCKGSEWLGGWVSFYKLKLSNSSQDRDDHIILQSMHRYIPRLHIIPVADGVVTAPDQSVVMGPESMTFTFTQTEFMAVTTYQNFQITQLKISHNPFARGFKENGHKPRVNRVTGESQRLVKMDMPSSVLQQNESKEGIVNLSSKNHTVHAHLSNVQESRLVLKPIMSTTSSKDELYVPCIRGKHALGDIVIVEKHPLGKSEESIKFSMTLQLRQGLEPIPKTTSVAPTTSKSTTGFSPENCKRRKVNQNCGTSPSPTQTDTTPIVSLQPELDDVEGLLFASFNSKEALEVHTRNKPANSSALSSPVSPTTLQQVKESVEMVPETDEKIIHMEAVLLQDLRTLKHRQVIHPVLQKVGLKLTSLNTNMSIDLQYLGVDLPLPPANLPAEVNSTSLSLVDQGLPFISRTGKTSDMTKIKGWKNKFVNGKEISSKCNGLQKNLSAFCSDMLDDYLESEAQQITERAEAFSANAEGEVAYQLPAKSSSYVKTLDSALKHRSVASIKPCPPSQKPLLDSAPSQAAISPSSKAPVQAEAQSVHESISESGHSTAVSRRLVSQRPVLNLWQNHGMGPKPPDPPRVQVKMMQMEREVLDQGLSRTQLTPDRIRLALSVILSKDMKYHEAIKESPKLKPKSLEPNCGQDFCRLGCVCSSLQLAFRGPLHCRQPKCMFGCDCFKRKILEQLSADESNQKSLSVFSMISMGLVAKSRQRSHTNKLWKRNINDVDREPLFIPEGLQCLVPEKTQKHRSVTHPSKPIKEEDKDPVYKYLESFLTCARVREFNSKPPPRVTIEPTTDNMPKQVHTTLNSPAVEETSHKTTANETEARKKIQIQSNCQWDKDHKMILKALCQRMSQNRLSKSFQIGPYQICPISKIFMRKPSGSVVTYRIQISKHSNASDDVEDEFEDSDEERLDGEGDSEDEDGQTEESEKQVGVIPFQGGVLPAGILRAKTKSPGLQACDLIQVNGKSYSQARLLLGTMGSLHPANRIAAHVTGRLQTPTPVRHRDSKKLPYRQKHDTPAIPPIINAKKTTDLKTPVHPQANSHLSSWRKGPLTLSQCSQITSGVNPVQASVLSKCSVAKPFQNSSTSSPVFLTVSPSLKTPSFLQQSGTYSFRIFPPATKDTTDQNPPGLMLPGGFTLLELPKPGNNETAPPSETGNTTNTAAAIVKAPLQTDALLKFDQLKVDLDTSWLGLDSLLGDDEVLSSESAEPCSLPTKMRDEKTPLGESDESDVRQMDTHVDFSSEGEESSDSDYCGDGDDDEELVDIETVEDRGDEAAVRTTEKINFLLEPRNASDQDTARDLSIQMDYRSRQKQHTLVERKRRSEIRKRFGILRVLLRCDLKANRLHILAMTLREIQNLVQTSQFLEEQREKLTRMNSVYIQQLTYLSGKSEAVIRQKLSKICERQKMKEKTMKWSPFFSKLLQSRAALLQSTTPESESQEYLSQSNLFKPPYQPNSFTAAAKERLRQMMIQLQSNQHTPQTTAEKPNPAPSIHPQAPSFKNQAEVTAAPLQVVIEPSGAPIFCSIPNSQTQVTSGAATVPVTIAKNAAAPIYSVPTSQIPSGHNSKPLSLPLIRSKTGRIILPSSLKPACQTYFTFAVMRTNQNNGDGELSISANTQPSDVDPTNQHNPGSKSCQKTQEKPSGSESSQKNQEKPSGSESSQKNQEKPSGSESSQKNQEKPSGSESSQKTQEKPSGSESNQKNQEKPSGSESNQKTQEKPSGSESSQKTQEKPSGSESNQKNQEKPSGSEIISKEDKMTPLKPELKCEQNVLTKLALLNKSISVPLKTVQVVNSQGWITAKGVNVNHMHPVYVSVPSPNHSVVHCVRGSYPNNCVVSAVGSENHLVVEKTRQHDTPGRGGDVSDCPIPAKRGRGRPKKTSHPSSAGPQKKRSLAQSKEDSPVRLSVHYKRLTTSTQMNPAANRSRPLTRGALGKDFPSAKKRSWIDVEKELEPEVDFD